MGMLKNAILLFMNSIVELKKADHESIMSDVSERNLCGRLAIFLTEEMNKLGIKGYYADTEYNRKQGGKIKIILSGDYQVIQINSDLIVHSRGEITECDNLIAIEMKKAHRPRDEKISDRHRLMAMTKDSYDDIWSFDGTTHPEHVCRYVVGYYIIIDVRRNKLNFEMYQKGHLTAQWQEDIVR
jgi:hypothetical protein